MLASKLVDSRKVHAAITVFCDDWLNPDHDDTVKEEKLQGLLDLFGQIAGPSAEYLPRPRTSPPVMEGMAKSFGKALAAGTEAGLRVPKPKAKKTKRGTKPKDDLSDDEAMTPKERAIARRMADEALAQTEPQEVMVSQVIKDVILPKYRAGHRNFCIPLRWRGRAVSTNTDRWKQELERSGIYSDRLEWVVDERSWQGPRPSETELPLVIM